MTGPIDLTWSPGREAFAARARKQRGCGWRLLRFTIIASESETFTQERRYCHIRHV